MKWQYLRIKSRDKLLMPGQLVGVVLVLRAPVKRFEAHVYAQGSQADLVDSIIHFPHYRVCGTRHQIWLLALKLKEKLKDGTVENPTPYNLNITAYVEAPDGETSAPDQTVLYVCPGRE